MSKIHAWLQDNHIEWLEYVVVDQSGLLRGKRVFLNDSTSITTQRLPMDVFTQTVNGDYCSIYDKGKKSNKQDGDFNLQADTETLAILPWTQSPTASVFCDAIDLKGQIINLSPRQILKKTLELYRSKNWQPIVALELEFYLFERKEDGTFNSTTIAKGLNTTSQKQPYGVENIDALNHFFDELFSHLKAQNIHYQSLIQEVANGQYEINLQHGEPLQKADEVCRFKRTVRETAKRHNLLATFMAKPLQGNAGSSMHIHQSVVDNRSQKNIFSSDQGESELFYHYLAGLQHYLPQGIALMLPYVNSYKRLEPHQCAPLNVEWSKNNRTVGLRIPSDESTNNDEANKRIENRLSGADSNPYLCLALNLALGYQGIAEKAEPRKAIDENAYSISNELPMTLQEAIIQLEKSDTIRALLGADFIDTFVSIKRQELQHFQQIITPWEVQNLSEVV